MDELKNIYKMDVWRKKNVIKILKYKMENKNLQPRASTLGNICIKKGKKDYNKSVLLNHQNKTKNMY